MYQSLAGRKRGDRAGIFTRRRFQLDLPRGSSTQFRAVLVRPFPRRSLNGAPTRASECTN